MEIVLQVSDKYALRVLKLIGGIKRVKVKALRATPLSPVAIEFLAGLKESVADVKRHQRGEIELESWDELYAELKAEETSTEATKQLLAQTSLEKKVTEQAHS